MVSEARTPVGAATEASPHARAQGGVPPLQGLQALFQLDQSNFETVCTFSEQFHVAGSRLHMLFWNLQGPFP